MARIPKFTGTSATVPVLQQNKIDPNVATQALQISNKGIQVELQKELNSFQQLNEEAERKEIMNNELQHQANLQTALPRLYAQLGLQVSNAVNNIRTIDEQQKRTELKAAEDIYLATNSIRIQEEYMNFTEDLAVSPDGTGYTKDVLSFVNERTEQLLALAPSEASRIEMYSYLGKFKIGATSKAKEVERNRRVEFRKGEFVNAASSLRAQALKNPDEVDTYVAQLIGFKQPLLDDGVSEENVSRMFAQAVEQVESGRLEGMANQGRAMEALGELNSDDSFRRLGNDAFIGLSQTIGMSVVKADKALTDNLRRQAIKDNFNSGILPPNTASKKEIKQIQSEIYKAEISKYMNADGTPIEGLSENDLQNILVDFYQTNPSMTVVTEHVQTLSSAILTGDPDKAVVSSGVIAALHSNPRTIGTLSSLPKNVVAEALKIDSQMKMGIARVDAVDSTRQLLRASDPNRIKINQSLADVELKVTSGQDIILAKVQSWYTFHDAEDIINLPEAALDYETLFRDEVGVHGDIQSAKNVAEIGVMNKWQVSHVNGTPQLIQNAPESIYSSKEMEWFNADLQSHVIQIGEEILGDRLDTLDKPINISALDASKAPPTSKTLRDQLRHSRALPFTLPSGEVSMRGVKLGAISGITSNDGNPVYGLFWEGREGRPIRLSDLDPSKSPEYLVYQFNKEKHDEFKQNEVRKEEGRAADKKWRKDMSTKYEGLKEVMEETAVKRNLTLPEKNGIIQPLRDIRRLLDERGIN